MRYWVMHLLRDVEPILHGSFSSKAFQLAKARELWKRHRGDKIYWLKQDEDGFLEMKLYDTLTLDGK